MSVTDPHQDCLTGCAHTYREAREARKERMKCSEHHHEQEQEICPKRNRSGVRLKLGPVLPDPLEGVYKQFQCDQFDKYMAAMGAGQMSISMILRSTANLKITQEADKGWRIITETTIKAKSIKGFNTSASKRIENKFFLGEPVKELLDDWDSRKVESVLELHEASTGEKNCCTINCPSAGVHRGLVLTQTADLNGKVAVDSLIMFQLDKEDPDVLVVTFTCQEEGAPAPILATRRFRRFKEDQLRKISVI